MNHAEDNPEAVRPLTSSLLDAPGIIHGFSTRKGGTSTGAFTSLNLGLGLGDDESRVATNLERFLDRVAPPGFRLATVTQVHGRRIVHVDQNPDRPFAPLEADGLITSTPGWLLGVRTADCVPILMASSRAVAAVHAGWRGTTAGIVVEAVRAFETRFDVPPAELRVAVGPAIGIECYEVGIEVVRAVEALFARDPRGTEGVVHQSRNRFWVDLKEANRRLLVNAGVPAGAIEILPHCVSCRDDLFFSHRRDRGTTGRMLNVIGLTGPGNGWRDTGAVSRGQWI